MGRSPCCDKTGLKKRPWTQEEDLKLTHYINVHGPGNWRTLPKNSGLQRCGKSCRLRWTNYLRPDIRRGRFSFEEEDTIIQLHSVLGNKWSMIAARLPGRTDNEIKNYWNTHVRKRLLENGIDPVTHRPRLNIMDLSSILNSASFNISNLLNIQTIVNPLVVRLATLLASSSLNQEQKVLFFSNRETPMNPNSNEKIANVTSSTPELWNQTHQMHVSNGQCSSDNLVNHGQTSQENLMSSPYFNNNSAILPNYINHVTPQTSQTSYFQLSNRETKVFDIDSIFPTLISSPTPLESSSMLINGSTIEDDTESYCNNMFEFEIPESFEFDNFMQTLL